MDKSTNQLNRISWLASYPKSGNTWIRCFLRAYQYDAYEPIDLNRIGRISMSDSRLRYYQEAIGNPIHKFTDDEINALRHRVQEHIAKSIGDHQVVKTHNARVVVNGIPLINREFTNRAIYVVRNPLDIVDSLADHCNLDLDTTILRLNDMLHTFGDANTEFVRQYLTSWSNHVKSWTESQDFPILVVRYEDLLQSPVQQFSSVIRFLGWMFDESRVQRAVQLTQFEVLQASEKKTGFDEISQHSKEGFFFRRGTAGTWKTVLSENQIVAIEGQHAEMMKLLGYS